MSLISDYNPLKSIWIPGAEIAKPEGIIVVVGPNSSGKTLFLKDIENYILTGKTDRVVCEGFTANRPAQFKPFVDELIERRYLQPLHNQQNQYRTHVPFLAQVTPNRPHNRPNFGIPELEKAFNDFSSAKNGDNSGWFNRIGMVLVAPLFLDQRRLICNRCGSFDYKTGTPDLPIQGLYLNSEAQDKLAAETGRVFGNAAWLDISEKDVLQLRASGGPATPLHGQTINPLEARKYRPVEDEGDGYRSYVGICLSLMLGIRPVSLLDEPELCLHPPQAYHIGRFIGQNSNPSHVSFVATHSSHVLRGILETGTCITVVRLSRQNGKFKGRLVNEQDLRNAVRNPRTRAESILDGVFSKGVVLVESDGDREEYLAASEAVEDYPSREAHFVPVGGTGGFAEPLRFYRTLNIPAAIIADLDSICDTDKVCQFVKVAAQTPADADILIQQLRNVVQRIKALPPPITEDAVKERLKELSEEPLRWAQGDDNAVRRKLNELEGQIKRVQRLKDGGIEAYKDHPEIMDGLQTMVDAMRQLGLFFVPVGELEDWAKPLMADYPKGQVSKSERAVVAGERIRAAKEKNGDIWVFVRGVLDLLNSSLATADPVKKP
jgi:hypothetical protein